ncbi:MAG: MoaD/ThiS family protein [Spirochaetota bacterium]
MKMKIRVRYFGNISLKLGIKEETFCLTGSHLVGDLIKKIVERYGEEYRGLFYLTNQAEKPGVLLTKNKFLVGIEERLSDGDEIFLIPVVSGG